MVQLRDAFAVVQSIGEDAEGEGLGFGDGFFARVAVGHHSGEVGEVGDVSGVLFARGSSFREGFSQDGHANVERVLGGEVVR